MSATLQRVDGHGDAELISAVRGGDVDAYGDLFGRHVDSARRLARQLVSPVDADDLVSEAFAKVLVVLQRGGGPDLAFRAYLLTAVRRLHVDKIRASSRLQTTGDLTPFDPGVPFRDTAVEGFENAAAARAFASLPERWQMVLWHTEVEGQKPVDVAPLLGMSANSVSALAYRAREGLRQAFLTMHVRELEDDECGWTHHNLGAYIRNGISRRDATKVEDHLAECRKCTAIYLELTEVNSNLSAILAPLLLGGLAAAYVGSAAGVAAKGGFLVLLHRVRELALANAPASAVAGVAATAVIGGAVFMTIDSDETPPAASTPPSAQSIGEPSVQPSDQAGDPADKRRSNREARPPIQSAPIAAIPVAVAAPGPADAPPVTDPAGAADSPVETEEPTPDPGPPDNIDPPVTADLRVTATATPQAGAVFGVVVSVAGLAPDTTATLTLAGQGISVVLTPDDRCGTLSLGSGECHVTSAPTRYYFTAVAVPGAGASLTFTVSPDGDTRDPDPSNNRASVVLGSVATDAQPGPIV